MKLWRTPAQKQTCNIMGQVQPLLAIIFSSTCPQLFKEWIALFSGWNVLQLTHWLILRVKVSTAWLTETWGRHQWNVLKPAFQAMNFSSEQMTFMYCTTRQIHHHTFYLQNLIVSFGIYTFSKMPMSYLNHAMLLTIHNSALYQISRTNFAMI